ncbi:MAG: sigma-70 family RNA polymerase sigma factor [Cyanobacteria bacterium P01_F01_bin.3]
MDSRPSVPPGVNEQSTDVELFFAIEQKQLKALNFLYNRYGKLVYTVAFRVINNVEEAEDITQEVFLKLWQKSSIYKPDRGSLSSFLVMLTRSRSIDRVRSRKSHHQRLQRWEADHHPQSLHNSPLERATLKERARLVKEAITQLSEAERKVLENAYYNGLSQSEIAQQTDVPLGTVKSRSRQALKKLRAILKHQL